jgi:hypothetical protein
MVLTDAGTLRIDQMLERVVGQRDKTKANAVVRIDRNGIDVCTHFGDVGTRFMP